MAEPDFRFIGERLDRLQAEMRELRTLKSEMPDLRASIAHVGARVARLADLEFEQVRRTMATDLAIVPGATEGPRPA